MAIQTKIFLPYLLVAVLVLCEVIFPHVSAARAAVGYYRRLQAAAANRLRRKECKDEARAHATCQKLVKELGFKVCSTQIPQLKAKLERSCAETCKFCGQPQANCRTSIYGCCWDAHTPRGDIYGLTGCPVCKDHLHLCYRFRKFCFVKEKGNNNAFMELHCPLTCGKCTPKKRVVVKGKKVKMTDWRKL